MKVVSMLFKMKKIRLCKPEVIEGYKKFKFKTKQSGTVLSETESTIFEPEATFSKQISEQNETGSNRF